MTLRRGCIVYILNLNAKNQISYNFFSFASHIVWNESDQKWYFVVEDVVLVLTDSKDPKQYIKRIRQRDDELAKGWVQIVPTLWVETAGGRQRMGCVSAKSLLRII